MKKLFLLLLILPAFALYSQEAKHSESSSATADAEQTAENSEDCERNISIYFEYYKAKNYTEAYPSWKYVVDNCSDFHPDIYLHGATIIDYILRDKSLSPEKRKEYTDGLMETYNKRLAKHPDTRPAMVLTRKAISMYNGNIGNNPEIIKVIKEAIAKVQAPSSSETLDAAVLDVYFVLALELYNSKQYTLSQMFDIYDEISEILSSNQDEMTIRYNNLTADETRELSAAEQREVRNLEALMNNNELVIGNIEARIQPIATCEMLVELYTSQFEENKNDEAWLAKTSTLLQNKECMDAPIYMKIAEAYYTLNPNARAAQAIARMAYNKKDYAKAAKFFREAAESASSEAEKSRNYLRLAQALSNQGSKAAARTAAQQALAIDPRMGNAYLLIGNLYASSANDCGNNEFEKRAVHFAALEMYRKAQSVDPGVAATARQAINSSSALSPDKQLIFQMGMAGKSHKIECWIQTSVSIPNL